MRPVASSTTTTPGGTFKEKVLLDTTTFNRCIDQAPVPSVTESSFKGKLEYQEQHGTKFHISETWYNFNNLRTSPGVVKISSK